eukprot:499076-Amphidinium_carterae.1
MHFGRHLHSLFDISHTYGSKGHPCHREEQQTYPVCGGFSLGQKLGANGSKAPSIWVIDCARNGWIHKRVNLLLPRFIAVSNEFLETWHPSNLEETEARV